MFDQDIRTLIVLNKDGVYEWKDPVWGELFHSYFKGRDDDDISAVGTFALTS
jgi:hypothetical protein